MSSTIKYYRIIKAFLLQNLFGWISCINTTALIGRNQGTYINRPGLPSIYDPDFTFLSLDAFPPRLPDNVEKD